ncbi:MAG TPA: DUF2911 domain-containing protein [Chryseosolibacter sp.]|nr:DUF2911 domain-containing protein [Chryseosolibacter sp.]
MKQLLVLMIVCIAAAAFAQEDKSQRPSPPAQARGKSGNTSITIDYSQPSVKNRQVWGALVPYGKVWRTGANETTTIEFSAPVTIEGKKIDKGRYALFSIPNEKSWTFIINKGIKWGAFSYKEDEDVIRFDVPVKTDNQPVEKLTFDVSNKGEVTFRWADVETGFNVK